MILKRPSGFLAKVLRFVLYGIPAFLIAIPLNLVLVEKADLPEPLAYAIVLAVQITINFFVCVLFVFERDKSTSLRTQFLVFASGIMLARLLDWGLYAVMVRFTPIHYLAVQIMNVFLFSIAKFLFARRALEGKA